MFSNAIEHNHRREDRDQGVYNNDTHTQCVPTDRYDHRQTHLGRLSSPSQGELTLDEKNTGSKEDTFQNMRSGAKKDRRSSDHFHNAGKKTQDHTRAEIVSDKRRIYNWSDDGSLSDESQTISTDYQYEDETYRTNDRSHNHDDDSDHEIQKGHPPEKDGESRNKRPYREPSSNISPNHDEGTIHLRNDEDHISSSNTNIDNYTNPMTKHAEGTQRNRTSHDRRMTNPAIDEGDAPTENRGREVRGPHDALTSTYIDTHNNSTTHSHLIMTRSTSGPPSITSHNNSPTHPHMIMTSLTSKLSPTTSHNNPPTPPHMNMTSSTLKLSPITSHNYPTTYPYIIMMSSTSKLLSITSESNRQNTNDLTQNTSQDNIINYRPLELQQRSEWGTATDRDTSSQSGTLNKTSDSENDIPNHSPVRTTRPSPSVVNIARRETTGRATSENAPSPHIEITINDDSANFASDDAQDPHNLTRSETVQNNNIRPASRSENDLRQGEWLLANGVREEREELRDDPANMRNKLKIYMNLIRAKTSTTVVTPLAQTNTQPTLEAFGITQPTAPTIRSDPL